MDIALIECAYRVKQLVVMDLYSYLQMTFSLGSTVRDIFYLPSPVQLNKERGNFIINNNWSNNYVFRSNDYG